MTWTELKPRPKGKRREYWPVKFGISSLYGPMLWIKKPFLDELGINENRPLRIFQGAGDADGKLRMMFDGEGDYVASRQRLVALYRIGPLKGMTSGHFTAVCCEYDVLNKDDETASTELIVTLPEQWNSAHVAPGKAKVAAPSVKSFEDRLKELDRQWRTGKLDNTGLITELQELGYTKAEANQHVTALLNS